MGGEMTMNVAFVESLLEDLDWTWADLAREMGLNKSTVGRVVRNETRPGAKFVFALLRVFPEHADHLFVPAAPKMMRTIEPVADSETAA